LASSELSLAASPPIRIVGGAVAWTDAKPNPGAGAAAGTRTVPAAAEVLSDVVRELGSMGGCSILLAAVAGMWVTTWGVINCPFWTTVVGTLTISLEVWLEMP
jgi:hypothetical protein